MQILMWTDELHNVFTLPYPGQRCSSWRLNFTCSFVLADALQRPADTALQKQQDSLEKNVAGAFAQHQMCSRGAEGHGSVGDLAE